MRQRTIAGLLDAVGAIGQLQNQPR